MNGQNTHLPSTPMNCLMIPLNNLEGRGRVVTVNAYERNNEARKNAFLITVPFVAYVNSISAKHMERNSKA